MSRLIRVSDISHKKLLEISKNEGVSITLLIDIATHRLCKTCESIADIKNAIIKSQKEYLHKAIELYEREKINTTHDDDIDLLITDMTNSLNLLKDKVDNNIKILASKKIGE